MKIKWKYHLVYLLLLSYILYLVLWWNAYLNNKNGFVNIKRDFFLKKHTKLYFYFSNRFLLNIFNFPNGCFRILWVKVIKLIIFGLCKTPIILIDRPDVFPTNLTNWKKYNCNFNYKQKINNRHSIQYSRAVCDYVLSWAGSSHRIPQLKIWVKPYYLQSFEVD